MASHNQLGAIGEEIAVDHLQNKGYKILERNWRYLKAEVDVIAAIENYLVAVEVKTRSSSDFGDPQKFVSKKKIKLLTMAVDHYVNKHTLEVEVRFDIIAITINNKSSGKGFTESVNIQHLEDAFLHF